jgi:hypothetical protein
LLLALLALAAVPARAQFTVYAVDYNSGNSDLYSIDPKNWSATFIGSTGQYLEALAISPSGQLFATNTNGDLFTLNTATGASTLIGSTGRGNIEALDFNGNTLLGVALNNTATLFSINTSSAAVTDLATLSPGPGSIRSIAVDSSGVLYIRSDGSPKTLSSVDLATGAVTSVGSLGGNSLYAMDFGPNGTLYGFDDNGFIYSINTSTGASTYLGTTGTILWLGATIQAVPEPATWALLVLGGGLILLGLRRRRA